MVGLVEKYKVAGCRASCLSAGGWMGHLFWLLLKTSEKRQRRGVCILRMLLFFLCSLDEKGSGIQADFWVV